MSSSIRIFYNILVLAYILMSIGIDCITARLSSDENTDNSLYVIRGPIKLKTRASKHYCGELLINTLSQVCLLTGGYAKRANFSHPYFYQRLLSKGNDSPPSAEMIEKTYAAIDQLDDERGMKFGDVFRRKIRGVSDECCTQACTLTTLMSYCARSN